jgi:hypothetical protein
MLSDLFASKGRLRDRMGVALAAGVALLLTGILLLHSSVGASRQLQAPPSKAVAAAAPPPNPPVSATSAAVSKTSANSQDPDIPSNQTSPGRAAGQKAKPTVADRLTTSNSASRSVAPLTDNQNADANTQFALGVRYARGDGVARDDTQAFIWFRKAAEQGNVSAQSTLATSYWLGRGIRKNNVAAYSWATIADEHGDAASGELLRVLAGSMTKTELDEARRKVLEWERNRSAQ